MSIIRPKRIFPNFKERFGPRGVLHLGDGRGRPHRAPALGQVGKQNIEDTGLLTKKRMETCDDEIRGRRADFIKRAPDDDKPFFVWYNTTAMHFRIHPPRTQGQGGRASLQRRDGGAR